MSEDRPLLLIVDDDVRTADLLGRMLRADGYDTEVAPSGEVAVERLGREPVPDAVITDFHLPGTDGVAVGQRARACRAGMPVFVVTGDPRSARSTGRPFAQPLEFLTKPVDYAELVRRLHAVIAGPT